jgi:peptidyl-prolyl cis-trans isomerase C
MQRKHVVASIVLVGLSALPLSACTKNKASEPKAKGPETKHGLTADQAKQALVSIGDTTITLGDFAEQLAEKSPYLRARYASPQRRRELLEEMVKFELLAREAKRRGLDADEEVIRTKKQVMIQQMMKAEFEDKVKLADISDQEIEAYYKAHPEEFNKPAQVRASIILIKDEAKAKRTLKQLTDKAADGKEKSGDDGKTFRDLAVQLNEDPATKDRFGDLQFFSKPSERLAGDSVVPDAVAEAAFKLDKIGDVYSEPVKTAEGFYIVKLTGKRKELARTLEHARRPIQHKLWREKREAAVDTFVKSLRDKAKVEETLSMLSQVQVPQAPPPAPVEDRADDSDATLSRDPARRKPAPIKHP